MAKIFKKLFNMKSAKLFIKKAKRQYKQGNIMTIEQIIPLIVNEISDFKIITKIQANINIKYIRLIIIIFCHPDLKLVKQV